MRIIFTEQSKTILRGWGKGLMKIVPLLLMFYIYVNVYWLYGVEYAVLVLAFFGIYGISSELQKIRVNLEKINIKARVVLGLPVDENQLGIAEIEDESQLDLSGFEGLKKWQGKEKQKK